MDRWRALRDSLARVRRDWRWGRHCGFPPCCIAMYCWDSLWSLPPSLTRTVDQGLDVEDSPYVWVPCVLVHHAGAPRLLERASRIAVHWWHVGRRRPPWRAAQPPPCSTTSPPGAMEEAWMELDSPDPDLEWV